MKLTKTGVYITELEESWSDITIAPDPEYEGAIVIRQDNDTVGMTVADFKKFVALLAKHVATDGK